MDLCSPEIGMMHLASSAKSQTLEKENIEGKSLIKMRKRTGPRTLPCGRPETTGKVGEVDCWPILFPLPSERLAPRAPAERLFEVRKLIPKDGNRQNKNTKQNR